MSAIEWDVEEYRKALGRITGASFTTLDELMKPFDVLDNCAPDVSSLDLFSYSWSCVRA
jgi:hypothetical protein